MNLKRLLTKILFFASLIAFNACNGDKNEEIIPRDQFIKIVAELHYSDALISEKGLSGLNLLDSVPIYYNYILNNFNTSREQFDLSLAYYSKDLESFSLIYDEVILNLSGRIPRKFNEHSIYKIIDLAYDEALIKSNPESYFGKDGRDLWDKSKNLSVIGLDSTTKADFSFKLKYHCLLVLSAKVILFPDDGTKNLRMEMKINYKDKTFDKTEKPITDKDGIWTDYQLFLKADSLKKVESVDCILLQFDSLVGDRHVQLKSITLKQYSRLRDTSDLVKKQKQKPEEPINRKSLLKNRLKIKSIE